ncbi:nitroreductase [Halobacillus sp. Marseille-P3879]|uniref:nitroreductase family protein n=1 Tax=Halobacillus sp. Marseille-P3879 TaxID=2045014 RepID=UPI000C7C28E8|nr:nitroreductase [Halobacillus sp. Marseille-P3879]
MDLYKAITERRSIHEFKSTLIEEKELRGIFQTASWAPNHRMKQPWNVKMFQKDGAVDLAQLIIDSYKRSGFTDGYSEEKAEKMMEGIKKFLLKIPHHALIYMEKDQDFHRYEEDYAAVCAFIQNVQLAAWGKNIGVLWTSSPYISDEKFIEEVGLNEKKHKVVAVLQMGIPERIPGAKPRDEVPITFCRESFIKRS